MYGSFINDFTYSFNENNSFEQLTVFHSIFSIIIKNVIMFYARMSYTLSLASIEWTKVTQPITDQKYLYTHTFQSYSYLYTLSQSLLQKIDFLLTYVFMFPSFDGNTRVFYGNIRTKAEITLEQYVLGDLAFISTSMRLLTCYKLLFLYQI